MYKQLFYLISLVLVLGMAVSSSADLVAHWKFDEGSGNTAHDTSGNGNDGTFVGDPVWMTGRAGGALEFNGSSDYIEVPFSESLRVINQGDFTIAAWFRLDEIPTEYKVVFQQGDDTSGGPGRTWLFVHQSNEIRSSLGGSATGSGVGIEGGTWYHAAVIVTEGGTDDSVQIYVNGEPAGASRLDSMEDSQGIFYIGAHKALGNIWDGLLDDLRIYSHALSETELLRLAVGPQASKPDPADGAMHEAAWASLSWRPGPDAVSHDVYIGVSFDDVNDGTGETFRGNQSGTSLVIGFPGFPFPEALVPGTTYYWRIDEVNEVDPNSPWKGNIWSFSTPPKTAYSPDPADGAESVDPNAILTWTGGYGSKLHTVYLGDNYDDVSNAAAGVPLGSPSYDPGTLEREKVLYWRVDEFDGAETHKGDVWSFTTPGAVGNPQPANGAADVQMTAILNWTPADNAASHELYFGTDADAVRNATTASPEYIGPRALGTESHNPGGLAWDSSYAWRVDEVYPTGTVKGLMWTFTTADFIVVDDFESYDDIDPLPGEPGVNRIFDKWIDGFGTTTNGALVGNDLPPYAEQGIVHGGAQSLVYRYDNNLKTSEATLTLVYPRDWTEQGVTKLILWFRGASGNAAERVFVALNPGAPGVVYHDDASATQMTGWNRWVIDLQAFVGVNLANVNTITIGIGTKNSPAAGGTGTMYFDDIRLIR
jgi:hypothetical protein